MKAAASQAVSYRNYRRARDRALTKLATAHFEHYKELLEKEKAFDEQMGKKWLDINGTTNASNVGTQPITTVEHSNEASNNRAYKSNDGGEA
jgi:hypothetical protein